MTVTRSDGNSRMGSDAKLAFPETPVAFSIILGKDMTK